MKILLAVHTYYPDHNGVQMVTQYIAEGLAKNNDVKVITELKPGYQKNEIYNAVEIFRISVSNRNFRFYGQKKEYIKKITQCDPDILICVCTQSWTFDWLCEVLEKLKCKKVLYTHGFSALLKQYPILQDLKKGRIRAFNYHWYWKNYYLRASEYMKKFDMITHLSKDNISYWYAMKNGIQNNIIMENAVEDSFFVTKKEHNNDEISFIYIANFDENKNQKMVFNAFVKANISKAKLSLIGGRENTYCRELINMCKNEKKRNPDLKVEVLVGISREKIYEIYASADIFLCGSKKEQYPIMLCEAAASRLAIISTPVGHAETLPGIIIVNSEQDMAEQIGYLANNPQEVKIRGEKLGSYAEHNYRIEGKVQLLEEKLKMLYMEN